MNQFVASKRKYKTFEGEDVYSKGELTIANYLHEHGIDYHYEPVRYIDRRKWVPDFHLWKEDVYIEYLGMAGDETYDRLTRVKMGYYYGAGYKVIYIYPSEIGRVGNSLNFKYKRLTNKNLA